MRRHVLPLLAAAMLGSFPEPGQMKYRTRIPKSRARIRAHKRRRRIMVKESRRMNRSKRPRRRRPVS